MQGVVQTRKFERTDPRIEETRLADEVRNTLLVGWGATRDALASTTSHALELGLVELPGSIEDLLTAPLDLAAAS